MTLPYLRGLDEQQLEAVEYDDGPLLVEAGPGSGKTRVLTCRVARLIDDGIAAHRVLAITFTNKAATEVCSRLERLLPGDASSAVNASTFHSACVRMLRADIGLVRPHEAFDIVDSAKATTLLRSVLDDLRYDTDEFPPNRAKALISYAKNRNLTPDDVKRVATSDEDADGRLKALYRHIKMYREYERRLVESEGVDFDDLLMLTLRLLLEHPRALSRWRARWDHLLVDEYQDTNLVQNNIAILLSSESREITVVGDSDQGIYAFRGADIRNILQLEDHFDDLRIVNLERNYRSTSNIVEAASSVVSNNRGRRDKRLWTRRPSGALLKCLAVDNERAEADQVAEEIIDRHSGGRAAVGWGDVAVLFRVNAQSRPLEHSFSEAKSPYRLASGPSFYERREVADAVAYLRAIVDPTDTDSVKRALRSPMRGVGRKTLATIEAYARGNGLNLMSALLEHRQMGLWRVATRGISEFLGTLDAASAATTPGLSVQEIVSRSGMQRRLVAEGTDEALDRLSNLRELEGSARGHTSIQEFLDEIDAVMASGGDDDDRPAVTLSTLHGAKGLEFKHVYIVGMEEGLLPHRLSVDDPEQVEEERRLAYVGMTRAMDHLVLTRAESRCLSGDEAENTPSRFIAEIPSHLLRDIRVRLRKYADPSDPLFNNGSSIIKSTSVSISDHDRRWMLEQTR